MSATPAPKLDHWDVFVLRHKKPGNLALHAVSAVLFFGSPVLALALRNPWILAGFSASGAVGALGHYAFDDGRVSLYEATVDPHGPMHVVRMLYEIARRTYAAEIVRVDASVRELGPVAGGAGGAITDA